MKSLQEIYAPHGRCFGCGPENEKGLRIRCFAEGDGIKAEFRAEPHHEAFPGVVNGGIIGTLLDCGSAWAATWAMMRAAQTPVLPCTVTADFHVKLFSPTPSTETLSIRAKPVEQGQRWVIVEATLEAGGKLCATCRGKFVAVKEDHPAFHRW
jgi:acyl-coenzyme A thioesterase PaaI-like protein